MNTDRQRGKGRALVEEPQQVGYKGYAIELRSQPTPDGKHVPVAVVHVHRGASTTAHPLFWYDLPKETQEEADRFALMGAMKWVDDNAP